MHANYLNLINGFVETGNGIRCVMMPSTASKIEAGMNQGARTMDHSGRSIYRVLPLPSEVDTLAGDVTLTNHHIGFISSSI